MGGISLASVGGSAYALPAKTLVFPRDRGSHPDFKTEWWYVTGHCTSGIREFGFQLTFFRSRVDSTQGAASKFAAKQLMFAHAAITDVQGKKLWHDQRISRDGFGVASSSESDMAIKLRILKRKTSNSKSCRLTVCSFLEFRIPNFATLPLSFAGVKEVLKSRF